METITYQRQDAIGILTLNRPERLNAINGTMLKELRQFFADRSHDHVCRAMVIAGAGRAFCAGLDTRWAGESPPGSGFWQPGLGRVQEHYSFQEDIAELVLLMRRCPQPLVAAVQGAATGGGLSIAIASDVRIATPDARFGASYVNLGLSGCDVGSSYFLPRIAGPALAADMIYSGRLVEAGEALAARMVLAVVQPQDLLSEALAVAQRWVERSSPLGLLLSKQVLNETVAGVSLETALKLENRNQVLAGQTADAAEASAAWGERRPPRWSNG